MKKLMLILMLLPLMAAAQTTMILGNCDLTPLGFEVSDANAKSGFSLYYSQFRMYAYLGNKIESISFYADNMSVGKKGRVFVSTDNAGKKPLAEKTFVIPQMVTEGMWVTIPLDTQYEIEQRKTYIGYELEGARFLAYAGRAVDETEYYNMRSGGWKAYNSPAYSAALYCTIVGDNLPQNDVKQTQLVMPSFGKVGSEVECQMSLYNYGASDVKSITVSYLEGENVLNTETVNGLNIQPRQKGVVALKGPQFATEGEYSVVAEVSRVNGEEDAAPYDNSSSSRQYICRNEFVQRKVLLEVFSTERCNQCPGGHANIEKFLGGKENVVELVHHAAFYDDSFTIPESKKYEYFYSTERTLYAPSVMYDRTAMHETYPDIYIDKVPVLDAEKVTSFGKPYEYASAMPAFYDIDLQKQYDSETRELSITVSGKQLLRDADAASVRLNVFLTENHVKAVSQSGADGDYYHNNLPRLCLTTTWGEEIGTSYSKTYTTVVDEAWDADRMNIVAFVSNYDSKNQNNCRVYNAEQVAIGSTSGISTVGTETTVCAYNLMGQRNAGGKGMVIVNGKKIINNR